MLIFEQSNIDLLSANSGEDIVAREYTGFVNTNCQIVKNIMLGIMRVIINENNIFDEDKENKLNSIYRRLTYEY